MNNAIPSNDRIVSRLTLETLLRRMEYARTLITFFESEQSFEPANVSSMIETMCARSTPTPLERKVFDMFNEYYKSRAYILHKLQSAALEQFLPANLAAPQQKPATWSEYGRVSEFPENMTEDQKLLFVIFLVAAEDPVIATFYPTSIHFRLSERDYRKIDTTTPQALGLVTSPANPIFSNIKMGVSLSHVVDSPDVDNDAVEHHEAAHSALSLFLQSAKAVLSEPVRKALTNEKRSFDRFVQADGRISQNVITSLLDIYREEVLDLTVKEEIFAWLYERSEFTQMQGTIRDTYHPRWKQIVTEDLSQYFTQWPGELIKSSVTNSATRKQMEETLSHDMDVVIDQAFNALSDLHKAGLSRLDILSFVINVNLTDFFEVSSLLIRHHAKKS